MTPEGRGKNVAPASSRQKVCCKQRAYPHPHAGKMPALRVLRRFSALRGVSRQKLARILVVRAKFTTWVEFFTFMASEREGKASVVPNSAPAGRRRGRSRQVPRVGTRHRFSYLCRRTAQLWRL